MNRKWDRLSEESKQSIIDQLILYFEQERGEKIGVLAAGQLLDFFQQAASAEIYNKGVEDAKKLIESRMDDMKFDLDDLLDL